jgi:hypothetical protein
MTNMLRSYLDRRWWMRLIILFIIVVVKNFALPILVVLHQHKLCNTHSGSLSMTKVLSIMAIPIFRVSHHGQKNAMR